MKNVNISQKSQISTSSILLAHIFVQKLVMLQRVQTIYLLLVIVALTSALFFPFATLVHEKSVVQLGAFGLNPANSDFSTRIPLFAGVFSILGTSIVSIGFYKKRKRQLLLGKINYLLILISLVFIFLEIDFIHNQINNNEQLPIYGIGTYLIVCTLPLVFLANRAIKKDENLIKSLDRLR